MARFWIVAVVTAVGIVFLAGCGQDPPILPKETGYARSKATGATAEQTEPGASLPKPPDGALVFGNHRKIGELGGYCWDSVCTEATFVIPPVGEVLAVPSGSDLLFEYGGSSPPTKVKAKAYALVRGKAERASKSLRVSHTGARTRIAAEVPPGEYVLEVFVEVPEEGSAFYYFHFRAAVDMVTLPTSGGPDGKGPEDR